MLALYAVVAGLAAGAGVSIPGPPALALLATGSALASLRRARRAALAGIFFIGLGAGGMAASHRDGSPVVAALASEVAACRVEGRVVEQAGALGTLVAIETARCSGDFHSRLGAVMFDRIVADAGSELAADGWFVPLTDDPFDSARARAGAAAAFEAPAITTGPVSGVAFRIAASVRDGLRSAAASVGGRRGALLLGLTIGDTEGLDHPTQERLRSAGLTHLVAVSGSNVAIVVGAIFLLFSRAGVRLRLAAAAAGLLLFVLVTGPEPSVLRAAAMGAVSLLALFGGRRVHPLRALGLALVAVVALRPGMVSSVGLHLSVAATLGIVLWAAPLARRMTRLPRPAALGIAATLAAQGAVAPVLIGVFGELSVTGPVANVIAMPAVAPATILGFAAGLVSVVAPGIGGAIAGLCGPFLGLILWAGDAFGGPSWAMVDTPRWLAAPAGVIVVAVAVRSISSLVPRPPVPATLEGCGSRTSR